MSEFLTCGICGAIINKETEKTHYNDDSNAFKIQAVKEENEKLKQRIIDLENSLEHTQAILTPEEVIENDKKDDPDEW